MNSLQHLNQEEKAKLQKIWDTDYQTIVSGKDNGVPFLTYVFSLHFKIYGETCSTCPNKLPSYIKKLKSLNTNKIMETKEKSNFVLKGMTTIPVPGTSRVYSNANMTDEIAVELLAKNPKRKALFSKMPEDVDALIEAYNSGAGEGDGTVKFTPNNLVEIGDKKLTIEQATSLLEKIGVKTRAKTVDGVQAAVNKLDGDKAKELIALSLDVKDETIVDPNEDDGDGTGERTKEDVQFDLGLAEQELEDLEAADPRDEAAIELKKEAITKLLDELGPQE